jgi:hypothetical protein
MSKEQTGLATLFGAFSGTPLELGEQLRRSDAQQAIAITLRAGSPQQARELASAVGDLVPLVFALGGRRQREVLEKLVDALTPGVAPAHLLAEARMAGQARAELLASGDWLTAAQVAEAAGFSLSNPSTQPNKWKRDGQIFAIQHQGIDYFPAYGLEARASYRPLKGLASVLATFGAEKDGWGLAYWFGSVNSFLGGKRPQDVLLKAPEQVLAAAVDEMAEIAHG